MDTNDYLALTEIINSCLLKEQESDWVGECLPIALPEKVEISGKEFYQVHCTWNKVVILNHQEFQDFLELAS